MRFRKKPVEIEARAFVEGGPVDSLIWWINSNGGKAHLNVRRRDQARVIVIETLEGDMEANVGDWIIRGVAGEFYPCKPDIFEATYEPTGDVGA